MRHRKNAKLISAAPLLPVSTAKLMGESHAHSGVRGAGCQAWAQRRAAAGAGVLYHACGRWQTL